MRPWVAGVLALLLAACGLVRPSLQDGCRYTVVIRRFPASIELARYPISEEGRFSLAFIHSVSHTPVRDDYVLENGRIVQVATVFETHEAGLPSLAEESGARGWERENGRFLLRMRRPIQHLVMRTDRRYRNRLHLAGNIIDLNQWDDQALELDIEHGAGGRSQLCPDKRETP